MFGNKEKLTIKLVLDEFEFEFFEGTLKEMLKVIKQWKKLKPDLRGYADSRIQQYYYQPYQMPPMPMPPVPPAPPAPQVFPNYTQTQQQPPQAPQPKKKPEEAPAEVPELNLPPKPIIPPKGRTIVRVK